MKETDPRDDVALDAKGESISEGIAFLLELEQISSKPVQNALILNILKLSNHIKHVELLGDQEGRKLLIYLKLSWWGHFWHKDAIAESAMLMLREVLPYFSFRVTYDFSLFEKAIKVAEKLATSRAKFSPRL